MDDSIPAFLAQGDQAVSRRAAEDRGLKAWITPGDVPAEAKVELKALAGYEEARAVTQAEAHDPVQGEKRDSLPPGAFARGGIVRGSERRSP